MADLLTTVKVTTFLRIYGEEVIDRLFRKDCCIMATNLAMRVCHYFDIAAYPQAVKVDIWNDRAWRHASAEEQSTAPARAYPPDAVVVSIEGTGKSKGPSWDGHLVLMVPTMETEFLLDMTIGQFSRPERGITLPGALLFELPEDWDRSSQTSVAGFVGYDDEKAGLPPVHMFYKPMVGIETFRSTPDWRDDWKGIEKMAGQLIRAAKAGLAGEDMPSIDEVVNRIAEGIDLKLFAELLEKGA